MLEELNFVWLIEQFKFVDIMSINIKLLKETSKSNSKIIQLKKIFKHKSTRVMALTKDPQHLLLKKNSEESNSNEVLQAKKESLSKE